MKSNVSVIVFTTLMLQLVTLELILTTLYAPLMINLVT